MVKTFATVLEHKWLVTQDGKDVAVKKVWVDVRVKKGRK